MAEAPQVWIKTFKNLNIDNYLAQAFGQTIYKCFFYCLADLVSFCPKK